MREKFSFCIFKIKRKVPSFENIIWFLWFVIWVLREEKEIFEIMNFCFQDFCVLFETFTYECFCLLFFHAPGQCLFWRDPFQHRLSHEPFSGQHDSLPKDHSLRLCGSFKRTLEPEHCCINYKFYYLLFITDWFCQQFWF